MYERTSGLSPHVAFAERASNLERRIRRITSRPRLFSAAVGGSAIAATVFATAAWKTAVPTRTAPLVSPAVGSSAFITRVLAAVPQKAPAPPRSTVPSPTETLTKQLHEVHQAPAPQSALTEAVPLTAVRAETSFILLTIEAANQAMFRLVLPQDSTTRRIHVARGRAEIRWGTYPPASMVEITSLDTTSQVHVEAAQNGRAIASGEGTYLVLRRDSVGVTIEAWSHVPPSRSPMLHVDVLTGQPRPGTAMSSEQGGGAATGPCSTPDSIAIRGLSRLSDAEVRSAIGITPKSTISGSVVTNALKDLDANNSFKPNATAACELIGGKSVLVFSVTERPRTRSSNVLDSSLDSTFARLVDLELQRVSSATDPVSVRRLDSEIATIHDRLRSFPGGVAVDREATTRVLLALEVRASSVRSGLQYARLMYTEEHPAVRNARAEDRAISERLAEIHRSM
jgi:hypothetical protein